MPQTINEVQRKFIQESARPAIHSIIRSKAILDAFVADYDSQQTAITVDDEVIHDAKTLTEPRADAPTLTGSQLFQLRNFCANMSAEVNSAAESSLIALAVHSVDSLRRG